MKRSKKTRKSNSFIRKRMDKEKQFVKKSDGTTTFVAFESYDKKSTPKKSGKEKKAFFMDMELNLWNKGVIL